MFFFEIKKSYQLCFVSYIIFNELTFYVLQKVYKNINRISVFELFLFRKKTEIKPVVQKDTLVANLNCSTALAVKNFV